MVNSMAKPLLNNSTQSSSAPVSLYQGVNALMPELAEAGELPVGVATIEIDGPSLLVPEKQRPLKLEVWYPSRTSNDKQATYSDVTRAQQPFTLLGHAFRDVAARSTKAEFPLVVLSHGYTGYRSIMYYLGEHLASHGYVVVGIDHTDSTNKEIDFKNNSGAGFHSTLLHRSRDQQAVLEHFTKHGKLFGANAEQASVIGYSMGGFGALNTVGACYNFDDLKAKAFGFEPDKHRALLEELNTCNAGLSEVDPRWQAMIAIAPWGGQADVISKLGHIKAPSLFIAGREDDVSGYENGVKKLFSGAGAEHKYLMVFDNARHNIAPHPAPPEAYNNELALGHYHEPAWSTENLNNINKHMILAFLDCHVKGDKTSCKMLPTTENGTQKKQADGKLDAAWPGFKDRFGTGVWFYRGSPTP